MSGMLWKHHAAAAAAAEAAVHSIIQRDAPLGKECATCDVRVMTEDVPGFLMCDV